MQDTNPTAADPIEAEFRDADRVTRVAVRGAAGARTFDLIAPDGQRRTIVENAADPFAETGSPVLDGLFALSLDEVRQCKVESIRTEAFRHGQPLDLPAFETGELWTYVWTRDLAYAVDLALAGLDVERCISSLLYKTSDLKPSVPGGGRGTQVLQDTGSGGSYPVSTDRVVWALAASRVLDHLPDDAAQAAWIDRALPILRNTVEHDRRLIHDPETGLYRGEQSFLDWREQTYPMRTRDDVLEVAMSQSLSTNVAHFTALKAVADWTRRRGGGDEALADRYDEWAESLRVAINARLFDDEAGMYAGYLLTDLTAPVRIRRYDLLGNALAILANVCDRERAHRVLDAYPTGPHGPSVVWPQESTVPIYHNHGIWPFVTAYWAKAARQVGHEAAAAAGVRSMIAGAARHLSNMENLDWSTGQVHADAHGISGPVINSRRQLWSVAGFVSGIQDVLFGMQTTERAIRFAPCLPAETRRAFLGDATRVALRRINYRGRRVDVVVTLPAGCADASLEVAAVTLNGRAIHPDVFVAADELAAANTFEITMRPATSPRDESLARFDDFENPRAVFGPPAPAWRSAVGQHGIDVVDGHVRLHYEPVGDPEVEFNIYRDGRCVARGVREHDWTDPEPADVDRVAREYAVESLFPETGNHSYPSEARSVDPTAAEDRAQRLPRPTVCDVDTTKFDLDVPRPGRYLVRVSYSNGNGTINTGITCAVKRAIVGDAARGDLASGYLILPQTGGPQTFHLSSAIEATFPAAGRYALSLGEDDVSRNMSYFAHNEHYTGHAGGGPEPTNRVTVDAIHLKWIAAAD